MKFCDRCLMVDMSVVRSRLKVVGIAPRGKCGCNYFCKSCRDLIVAERNTTV